MEENLIGNPDAFDLRTGHEYTGYRQNNRYEYDPGVFVLPVASREANVVVARVHGGMGIRRVSVAAAKKGAPPILPAATDTDRDTLVSAVVNVPLPAFLADSPTFNWVATGEYIYVTSRDGPRIPGRDMLPAGQYPFPLPLQDAAIDFLTAGGSTPELEATKLKAAIPTGNYLWPYTVMPPQFFNSVVLRDSDKSFDAELRSGGTLPGLGD